MRLLRGLLALLAAFSFANAKPRVASLNMCTDQLVLALADDDQILGLSSLARDPALSYYRDRAMNFRQLSGTAEDALALKADVIVTAAFARPITRALLTESRATVETFADARNLDDVRAQIVRMGQLLGQPDRASAAIAVIDRAAVRAARPQQAETILPLERRGWVTGRETLLGNLLTIAGFRNLGADLAEYGALMPLETLVQLAPDRLLLSSVADRAEDQGAAFLQHPALRRLMTRPAIILPDRLTVCAGPMAAEALDRLTAAARSGP